MSKKGVLSVQSIKEMHSKRRRLKKMLVVGGLILLAGLIAWPYVVDFLEEQESKLFPTISVESVDLDKKTVTKPKMIGADGDSQPYEITAASAEQAGENQVILDRVQGTMTLKDGKSLLAESSKGKMATSKTESVYLYDGVQLTYDKENRATTKDAQIDFKKGIVYGSNPIEGRGPDGVTSAQEFSFDYKKKILKLKGNATLTIFDTK
jgi:hypothetical protein